MHLRLQGPSLDPSSLVASLIGRCSSACPPHPPSMCPDGEKAEAASCHLHHRPLRTSRRGMTCRRSRGFTRIAYAEYCKPLSDSFSLIVISDPSSDRINDAESGPGFRKTSLIARQQTCGEGVCKTGELNALQCISPHAGLQVVGPKSAAAASSVA